MQAIVAMLVAPVGFRASADGVDDAAMTALAAVDASPTFKVENLGMLYRTVGGIKATRTQHGNHTSAGGRFRVPKGSLVGMFHNHPPHGDMRQINDSSGEEFSLVDKRLADRLGVRSYISTPSGRVRKYDPITGEVDDVGVIRLRH